MNAHRTAVLGLAIGFLLLPVGVAAQQPIGLGLSAVGGYYTLQGEDFEQADPGFGAEGVLRLSLLERLQLGGGLHWSRHRVDALDTDLDVLVIFAEPRLTFRRELPGLAPFLAGRAGYALQNTEVRVEGLNVDIDAAGYLLGAIAGLELPLGRHVALEGSGAYYWLSFGEPDVAGAPLTLPESEGSALGARLGMTLSF